MCAASTLLGEIVRVMFPVTFDAKQVVYCKNGEGKMVT